MTDNNLQGLTLSLVSLNNVCRGFLHWVKCKEQTIVQGNTPNCPAHNVVYRLDSSIAVCTYWSEDETGRIPAKRDIERAYIDAYRQNDSIPRPLEELYRQVMDSKGRQGRSGLSNKERTTRSLCAIYLRVLAMLEKKYCTKLFPLKKGEQARMIFYKMLGREPDISPGTKNPFNAALALGKADMRKLYTILEYGYKNNKIKGLTTFIKKGEDKNVHIMSKPDGTPYTMQDIAWEAYWLLRQPAINVALKNVG